MKYRECVLSLIIPYITPKASTVPPFSNLEQIMITLSDDDYIHNTPICYQTFIPVVHIRVISLHMQLFILPFISAAGTSQSIMGHYNHCLLCLKRPKSYCYRGKIIVFGYLSIKHFTIISISMFLNRY